MYTTITKFIRRFMRTKKPTALVTIIPLSFIMGYQLDMAFGNKMEKITGEFQLSNFMWPGHL